MGQVAATPFGRVAVLFARGFVVALATLFVAVSARAECWPVMLPTAEMVRSQHGKPDQHMVTKCGGGANEYGTKIAPWPCLVWLYEGKGKLFFEAPGNRVAPAFKVVGCNTPTPRVVATENPVWQITACADVANKTAPCNSIGLGVDPPLDADYTPPPEGETDGEVNRETFGSWLRGLARVCATRAEAVSVAKECASRDAAKPAAPPAHL